MDRHRMPHILCWRDRDIRRTLPPQRDLELRDTVHAVKETKEVNSQVLTTKGLFETEHEFFEFRILAAVALEIAECAPGEADHFLVTLRQEPNVENHFCEEPRSIGSSRKAKNVDLITWSIETHEKLVAADDVVYKGCADSFIVRF